MILANTLIVETHIRSCNEGFIMSLCNDEENSKRVMCVNFKEFDYIKNGTPYYPDPYKSR